MPKNRFDTILKYSWRQFVIFNISTYHDLHTAAHQERNFHPDPVWRILPYAR